MRRLVLWVVLLLWPGLALAAEVPYEERTMLYYPRLTQAQQVLFDSIYQTAQQGGEEVPLPEGTLYDEACRVMDLLLLDCPELCALDMEYSVSYLQSKPEEAVAIRLRYVMPLGAQGELLAAAQAMADRAYGDDFQREWILHDLLCQQAAYDQQAEHCHSAYGALAEGRAVCDGYARAMTLLLRLSGIPCGVVRGQLADTGAKHAWNLVQLDGAWTWLDPTNNDQGERITYFYYNMTDDWLLRSYIPQPAIPLPPCTEESFLWHAKTWRLVQRTEDMELHIFNNFRNLAADGTMFNLRFANWEDYLSLRDGTMAWAQRYNQGGEPGVQGMLHTFFSDAQQCVMVELEE